MEAVGRNFERRNGKIELYQIGTEAADAQVDVVEEEFAADRVAIETQSAEERGATSYKRIEDCVAFVSGGEEDAF